MLSPSSPTTNMVSFEIATLSISGEMKLFRVVLVVDIVEFDLRKNVSVEKIFFCSMR